MTDLEIVRLCAVAMGYEPKPHPNGRHFPRLMWVANGGNWNPLDHDEQAMALVKKFRLGIVCFHDAMWSVNDRNHVTQCADLNRAICECVAKMQKE